MVPTRSLVGASLFLLLSLQGKNGRRTESWCLPQSRLGVGKRRGFITTSTKKSSNILHLLVKKVICGGKNLSGKSEADDVLTHA